MGRKANYSDGQIIWLAGFVTQNRERLFGKAGNCSERVQKRREAAWEEAAKGLAALGCPSTTGKSVRLLWNEQKSRAKKYHDGKSRTGGGPCVPVNPRYEAIIDALVPQAVHGIRDEELEAGISNSQLSENAVAASLLHSMMEPWEEVNGQSAGGSTVTEAPEESEDAHVEAPKEREEEAPAVRDTAERQEGRGMRGIKTEEYLASLLEVEQRKFVVMQGILKVMEDYVYGHH